MGSAGNQQQQNAKRSAVNMSQNGGLMGSRRAFPFKQAGACIVLKNSACNPNLNQNFKSIAAPLQPQSAPVPAHPVINMNTQQQQHGFGYPECAINCGGSHNNILHVGNSQQQQHEICSMSAE